MERLWGITNDNNNDIGNVQVNTHREETYKHKFNTNRVYARLLGLVFPFRALGKILVGRDYLPFVICYN